MPRFWYNNSMASLVYCALTYILCVLLALFATVAFRAIGRRGLGFVFAFLSSCVLVTIVADKTTNRTDICDARLPGDGAETLSHLRDAEPGTATNDPPPLAFAAFGATASNVVFSAIWSTNVPPGSRIELHEKLWSLTNAWSPVLSLFVLPSATNWTETLPVATNRPTAAFYSLYADVLSISFPSLVSTGCTSGFRLSVATTDDPIPVLVERSERPAEFPPYDPGFAENPFADSPGLSYDSTNGTVTADGPGSFVLPTGDALVVISPSLVFGTPHDYAGETLVYDDVFGTYSVCSAYPLDEPCLWENWHVGTSTAFGCTCVPEFSLGTDVSDFDEITTSLEVVDDFAVAKVFLGDALVWSNSYPHARYGSSGGRSDFLSEDGCSSCGSCSTGDCDAFDGPSVGSVRFRVSLGSSSDGKVSGFLWFDNDAVFLPDPSSFSLLKRPDAHVSDATVNGVRTVICSDRGGRTLVVSNVVDGVRIGVTFTATGAKDRSWEITRDNGAMRFRKFSAGDNLMSDVSYSPSGGTWTVTDNTSGRSETTVSTGRTLYGEGECSRTVETVVSCGTVTASVVRVTSELVGGGDDGVIRETERSERRADGTWATSYASYWDYCGSRRNGQVRMVWGDDRAWCWTDYDELGREVFRLDQRDGSAAPEEDAWYSLGSLPDGTDAFATVLDYTPHSGDSCHANDWDKARTESRYVVSDGEATLIARTWTRYVRGVAANGWPTVAETTIRACSQTACINNPGNAVSTVVRYDDETSLVPYLLRGETISETDEDGVTTTHEYAITSNVLSCTSRKSYQSHPYPTFSYVERDLDYGLTLYEATRLTAAPTVEFGWRRHTYDSRHRLRFTQYDDGSSETNDYSCCRLLSRTDRNGAKTLHCATTGTESLYHAEEEVYFSQLPRGGDYIPDNFNSFSSFQNAFRVTQHHVDAFGRETNTVVRADKTQGAATNAWSTYAYGYRTVETCAFPCGTSDLSVRVDPRGLVTTMRGAETQAFSLSVVEERLPGADAPDVVVTNLSFRGGGTVVARSANGHVVTRRSFSEYAADGTRRDCSVVESDDGGTVTNSVTTFDILGRPARVETPTSCVTNVYDGASARVVATHDLVSGLAATNIYDECGELVGAVSRGVRSESRTDYAQEDGAWWRVESQFVSSGDVTNSASASWTQLTGLSDALRSRTRRYADGVLVESAESSFDPATLDLTETAVSATEGSASRRSRFGRTLEETTSAGTAWTYYDYFGNVFYVKRSLSPGGTVYKRGIYGYNDLGDLTDDGTFTGGVLSSIRWKCYGYDARGNRIAETNELGEAIARSFDAEGRVVAEDGATYPLRTAYDSSGRRTSLQTTRDGVNFDVTGWGYDAANGLCTNKVYADGSAETYTYAADALPLRTIRPSGAWTENVYDANRRKIGQSSSDPSCAHGLSLDAFGRTVAASNAVAAYAYTLANCGVATNETSEVGALSLDVCRAVDPCGRVVSLSRDGVADEVVYDPTNGTVAAISNAEAVVTYAYTSDLLDDGGDLVLVGGVRFERRLSRSSYFIRDVVTGVVNASPVVTNAWSYSYDSLKRPVSRSGDTFAYNRRGEVASATVVSNDAAYAYDGIGNATTSVWNGVATTYAANELNQYTAVSSAGVSSWLPYSANGELTSLGGRSFFYDAKSRLVAVGDWAFDEEMYAAGHSSQDCYRFVPAVSNRYDHLDRRVQKITPAATHTYFYDGWMLIKEIVASTNGTTDVIEYHWGKDLSGTIGGAGGVGGLLYLSISNSSTPNTSTRQLYIPFYDAYGNVMGYWDAQGTIVAEYTYDAFGKLISSSGPMADVFAIRYSTKYFDSETGLYYYGYRFYSPELMRWIARDPIGENGGVNLYAININNPVSSVDSLGLTKVSLSMSIENKDSGINILPFVAIRMTVVEPPQHAGKLYFIQLARDKGTAWKVDNQNSIAGPYYYSQVQMRQFTTVNDLGQDVVTLNDSPGGQVDYVDFITAAVEVNRTCGMYEDKITKKKIHFRCNDIVDVLAYKRWRFNPDFNPRYDFNPPKENDDQFSAVLTRLLESKKWKVEICPDVTITVKKH